MAILKNIAGTAAFRAHFGEAGPSNYPNQRSNKGKERSMALYRERPTRQELALQKARRERIHVEKSRSHVYVGNLAPLVNENDLREFFKSCGPIGRVTIRRTSTYVKDEAEGFSIDGSRYATVEFNSPRSHREALQLTGSIFFGSKIRVVLAANELPDLRNLRDRHTLIRENGGRTINGIAREPTLIIKNDFYGTHSNGEKRGHEVRLAGPSRAPISSPDKARYHRVNQ